jgi:hypothetical protein
MQSLGSGISPNMNVRVPSDIRLEVKRRAAQLGVSEARYVRAALDVALGDRCCVGTLYTGIDPFATIACRHQFEKSVGN